MEQRQEIYRKSSLERIQSPDQLDQYLKVTTPLVWVLLAAILVLLVSGFWWTSQMVIASRLDATGTMENGTMTIVLRDETARKVVASGMMVQVGEITGTISSMTTDAEGLPKAVLLMPLPDGTYNVQISYKTSQLLSLLFN
ncbi:MAG: hypothetical protein J6U01_08530 [Clostridia bacterium]|nr:hypothetical protein [Clostridia bacterium]